jgi:excisionase family DNA binding protein
MKRKYANKPRSASARFMRVKEYAEHLGISERTLREWLYQGIIPFLKVQDHLILIDPIKADRALERLEIKELS